MATAGGAMIMSAFLLLFFMRRGRGGKVLELSIAVALIELGEVFRSARNMTGEVGAGVGEHPACEQ